MRRERTRRRTIDVVESGSAADRLAAAEAFLDGVPADGEALIVGASRDAVDDLVRRVTRRRAPPFGLHRFTLTQLAARLAAPALSAARPGHRARASAPTPSPPAPPSTRSRDDRIPYFAPVARMPGLHAARSLPRWPSCAPPASDRRHAGRGRGARRPAGRRPARLRGPARRRAGSPTAPRCSPRRRPPWTRRHADPLIGLPLLLLDVAARQPARARACDRGARAPSPGLSRCRAATSARRRTRRRSARPTRRGRTTAAGRHQPRPPADLSLHRGRTARRRTRRRRAALLRPRRGPRGGRDRAPDPRRGARRHAVRRMAVFLRSPETYAALLEDRLPPRRHPRLLRARHAAAESRRARLSRAARLRRGRAVGARFAEYLSLGQVPRRARRPRDRLDAAARRRAGRRGSPPPTRRTSTDADDAAGDRAALRRAPWRWESLLVDAAVIGGADRWARRLARPRQRARRCATPSSQSEEPDAPRLAGPRARPRASRRAARASPCRSSSNSAALPRGATLGRVAGGARRARRRGRCAGRPACCSVLAELAPMATVGPVALDEVRDVLAARLSSLTDEPPADRYGRVLVTTLDDARGRSCRVVFVPGLAERIFPQRPREDPLLLDAARAQLSADLSTQEDALGRERLLLRLAVGAAERRVVPLLSARRRRPGRARASPRSTVSTSPAPRAAACPTSRRSSARRPPRRGASGLAGAADPAERHRRGRARLATSRRPVLHAPAGARAKGARAVPARAQSAPRRARCAPATRAGSDKHWSALDGLVRAPGAGRGRASRRAAARPRGPTRRRRCSTSPPAPIASSSPPSSGSSRAPRRGAARAARPADARQDSSIACRRRRCAPSAPPAPCRSPPPTWPRPRHAHRDARRRRGARSRRPGAADPARLAGRDRGAARRSRLLAAPARRAAATPGTRRTSSSASACRPTVRAIRRAAPSRSSCRRRPAAARLGRPRRARADGGALRVTDHKTGADRTAAGPDRRRRRDAAAGAVRAWPSRQRSHSAGDRRRGCSSAPRAAASPSASSRSTSAPARRASECSRPSTAPSPSGFLPPGAARRGMQDCDFRLVCGPHEEERVRRKHKTPHSPSSRHCGATMTRTTTDAAARERHPRRDLDATVRRRGRRRHRQDHRAGAAHRRGARRRARGSDRQHRGGDVHREGRRRAEAAPARRARDGAPDRRSRTAPDAPQPRARAGAARGGARQHHPRLLRRPAARAPGRGARRSAVPGAHRGRGRAAVPRQPFARWLAGAAATTRRRACGARCAARSRSAATTARANGCCRAALAAGRAGATFDAAWRRDPFDRGAAIDALRRAARTTSPR